MKNNELLKSMPVSQPVSAESLLITTTESNHKETEILHQLEISNLLEQLKNN